jgi:ATP-binding cassette subfamily B protein
MKTVKAFGYESSAEKKFDGINTAWRGVNVSAVFFSSLTNPVTRFINAFIYALVALAGGMCAANLWNIGVLTAGGLSCMLNYASKFTRPFNEISGVATELASALVSADRIFALLDEKEEASDQGNIVLDAKGNVKLDDVAFSYTKERELIKNLNLDVKRGQRIAIVGPTGCGKTTLINLLMRFYDVDEGSVSVDGNDVRSVTRKSLRNGYGMVLQESWIKRATVRENLTFCGNASDEEIARVAKKCNIDGFISRLKDGYDTVITDGDLSQGEKQMLCIARVMLAEPKMLILDEATSSVDMRTERDIGAAFDILMEGKTSFIVAHRLSTIKNADMILVMKDGKIIEKGTHKELFDKGGFYRQLYESRVEQNV